MFLLTSREDPLPSVALEALSAGVPVVAFEDTGGIPDLLAELDCGSAVPLGDVAAMADAACRLAASGRPRRTDRARTSQDRFRFGRYAQQVLALAQPDLLRISVAVLSHNYARFLPDRLGSVFAQSHPVHEVLVLDDGSTDDSVAEAERIAASWQRTVTVDRRLANSGSVFAQWRRAAELATGDWLWLAEADDRCGPGMLSALAGAVTAARDPAMAFCDSAAIDGDGAELWPDHKTYYAADGVGTLATDAVFDGRDFLARHLSQRNLILNASAVLWRRRDLLAALSRCEADLQRFRFAGDWRLYAETLMRDGAQVAYVARPLNQHRRHSGSVTGRLDAASHRAEIRRMHEVLARLLGGGTALRSRQRSYLRSLRAGGVTASL